jgi:hypothetical protein
MKQCKHNYDLVIDDASHSSHDQQVALRTFWLQLKSGGIYCIESLHWQPYDDYGMKTRDLLLEWKNGNKISSEFTDYLDEIAKIDFYPSKSKKWSKNINTAFCVITKK